MTPIKIYLTDAEKQALHETASESGLSISAFVRSYLEDLYQGDPILYAPLQKPGQRDRSIKLRVSDEEYTRIKTLAGEQSISHYARRLLLSNGHPINIAIETEDISDFASDISDQLQHFQNVLEALAYRSVLQPQETDRMLQVLMEIRDDIKEMTRIARNNRKSIRSAGLRWLKRQFKEQREELL